MKYDLTRLNNNIDRVIKISKDYAFSSKELQGTDLLTLNCHIEGEITKNSLNNIHLNMTIEGIMVMPCAITLKETEYPFTTNINDDLDELLDSSYQNEIDLYPIVWEYILMEIPIRVVSEEAKNYQAQGDGWTFTTKNENTSSPFDELKDLL